MLNAKYRMLVYIHIRSYTLLSPKPSAEVKATDIKCINET